ncbi:hypothetical protein [Mycolicibacterium komossense]|uniref:PE family protein n=1 Tax=Mycolicibacterium komossense TaxID=1779 RepID=A0ABT3C5R1_9MYCO|nr:hypothetical protein [Mycolicibacterium komossense]MCV7224792.1 hypothetical protein [Mycolicibacterium komossense]
MGDAVHLASGDLQAAMSAWRADVPGLVAYPELPVGVDDAATAAVLAAMAGWPIEHTTMGTHRETAATKFDGASAATTAIVSTADDDGAARIAAVEL